MLFSYGLISWIYIYMMLGSKAFDPSDTGLLCTACSRNPQNIRNSLIFLRKMATDYFSEALAFLSIASQSPFR